MKIAVCMYGLLRTHKETALSLKKHVLDVNDADLFIFSPNKAGGLSIPEGVDINLYKSENKKNICKMDNDGDLITRDDLFNIYGEKLKGINLYDAQTIKFTQDFSDIAMNDILIPERVLSLFYNMSGAVKLALNSNVNYDAIVLLRPDLAFYSPLNVDLLNLDEVHIPLGGGKLNDGKEDMPCYYVGYYKNTERGELIRAHAHMFTDQLIVFGKDCFKNIENIYDDLSTFLSRGVPFHPETLLFYGLPYLSNKKVNIHEEWLYEIFRNNTRLIENDDILIKYRLSNELASLNKNIGESAVLTFKYRVKRKIKHVLRKLLKL